MNGLLTMNTVYPIPTCTPKTESSSFTTANASDLHPLVWRVMPALIVTRDDACSRPSPAAPPMLPAATTHRDKRRNPRCGLLAGAAVSRSNGLRSRRLGVHDAQRSADIAKDKASALRSTSVERSALIQIDTWSAT